MKEIQKILSLYDSRKLENKLAALATVVNIEGSSFRRIGARMLIFEDGIWSGGISGGCLEGDVLKKAKKVMLENLPAIITYDTRDGDPYQIGVGLGCRGKIDILIQSINSEKGLESLDILRSIVDSNHFGCIAHIIKASFDHDILRVGKLISNPDSIVEIIPDFKKDFDGVSDDEGTFLKYYDTPLGQVQILFEAIPESINLIVLGSNYDIPSIVQIAKLMGWTVQLFSDVSKINKNTSNSCSNLISIGSITTIPEKLITPRTALLLMTHDYKTDLRILEHNYYLEIPYIGILGPKTRFLEMRNELEKKGIHLTEEVLKRIHSPVGLDLGASTPDTIALSICAEILAFFNKRSGGSLKYRTDKIYDAYQVKVSDPLEN